MTTFTAYGRVDAERAGYTLFSGSAHSTTYTKGELALTIRDNGEAELFAVMRGLKLTTQTISFPNQNLEVFEHLILKILAFQEKPYLALEAKLAQALTRYEELIDEYEELVKQCAALVERWELYHCDAAMNPEYAEAVQECAKELASFPAIAEYLDETE